MKPVPLWVVWEKGKGHYVTEQGCTGWPGSRQSEPMCGGSQSSLRLTHLVAQPWDREDRNPTLKKLSTVSGVWDIATLIKLWVLILHMTLVGNGPRDSSKAPGSRPPSLICKMGIQLGHIIGKEVCLGVWRTNISPVFHDTG